MTKNKILPIIKYRRRIPLSTALFTYSILFFLLFMLLGTHKMNNDERIGTFVIFGILISASLVWMVWNTYWIVKRSIYIEQTNMIIIFLWVPLIGAIANFIVLKKVFNTYKRDQLLIDQHWKHEHEPLPVVILLLLVTFAVVLALWLVYATLGHIATDDATQQPYVMPGIIDVLLSPVKGFIDGADIIVYLLIMGVFLQIVNQTKSLEAGIGSLVRKLKGKELMIIPVIMIFFSLGGAVFGMCEETIAFYAIIMPIVIAAGFDAITGVLMILFGAGLGVCASVINPFMIMTSVEATTKALPDLGLSVYSGMVFRLMVYIVFTTIGIILVTLYARKVKKNPKKSLIYDLRTLHQKTFQFDSGAIPEFTGKRKAILAIFFSAFALLILGVIPWDKLFNVSVFEDINAKLINAFPFLSTGMGPLGAWELVEFSVLFLTASIIIAAINWAGVNNFYRDVLVGAKDFINVAFVIAVARGLSIILANSGVNEEITHGISNVLKINKILGTLVMFLAFIALSIFIPSTSGFASAVFGPIAAPALYGAGLGVSTGIASASIANGLVNLCSPTAGPFVIGCEMAKVPLKNFYRSAWKILLIIALTGIVMLIMAIYLPTAIVGK